MNPVALEFITSISCNVTLWDTVRRVINSPLGWLTILKLLPITSFNSAYSLLPRRKNLPLVLSILTTSPIQIFSLAIISKNFYPISNLLSISLVFNVIELALSPVPLSDTDMLTTSPSIISVSSIIYTLIALRTAYVIDSARLISCLYNSEAEIDTNGYSSSYF